MDDTFAQLETQYCPPLDPALLSAILSDYDLGDVQSVESAKVVLNSLKENASLEEADGFDPSGTGTGGEEGAYEKNAESRPDRSASSSRETESTGLSHGVSFLDLEDGLSDVEHPLEIFDELEGFEELDENAKVKRLQGVLGNQVNRYSIQYALRKCDGNLDAAVEELLIQAFQADDGHARNDGTINAKGIDGFSSENIVQRGRRGKAKHRLPKDFQQRRSSSVPGLHDGDPGATANKWKSASEDIDFIATRSGIATATVSSIYYSEGASVPQTVAMMLKVSKEESKKVVTDEAKVSAQAKELGRDFPTISSEYLAALVRLTHPSTDAAHDLAEALTSRRKDTNSGGIQIIPRYTPLQGLDDDADWSPASRKAKSATSSRSPSVNSPSASLQRDAYVLARAAAFSKASEAHRKARSDRLMGGAAAYYGQVGREYSALSSNASANAADQLVASQSTSSQLDLHGVDVLNAVRIAQEKVEEWWNGLGENRINGRVGAEDRQSGYRIVVGLGRHSEGGKGKLGPAVTKMLKQEGWRVEAAGAVIVVRGPLKR
ncbi:hypothetical protein LTR37_016654 [Vermiconidia calcicola]|uniref:Uncharacterized protein n=1 Tax=Vermiconidia calcicola TaxID=1690605 RepID=A0ACC3MNT8_9PEZI|nr:hypothetical protein LTR37_016654 [Vermiconidia calcicola]